MNIKELISHDIPEFTGIFLSDGSASLEMIRNFGVSLAWKFNKNKGEKFDRVLIAGNNQSRGQYFIAEIAEIVTIKELSQKEEYYEVLNYQNKNFNNWILQRINGVIFDNTLNERLAIVFKNPTEIRKFSQEKIEFLANPVVYIFGEKSEQKFNKTLGERIEIKNIGKINNAEIKLNGLTVIAGENDTGKSTIGKLIFSIVKAISRYEQDLNESKIHNINKKIEKLYFNLRQKGVFSHENDFRNQFHPREFLGPLHLFLDKNQLTIFSDEQIKEQVDAIFKFKFQLLEELSLSENEKSGLIKLLTEIKKNIFVQENRQEQIKRALNNVLFSEFYSEITPKGTKRKSNVNYYSGNLNILNFEIENNSITSLNIQDKLIFQDVIFIETPLLLQMYDLISNSETLFQEDTSEFQNNYQRRTTKTALHIKDLITKIEGARYFSGNFFENNAEQIDILKKISTIINGGYTFDRDEKEIVFSQKTVTGKNVRIKPSNTASGIKSFGIIQLLIQANMLNDRSLLVIDEPENHLHPEWQLKYADMIIELVKSDISVIISSHSPYMIQGLKYYSERADLKDKTSYYLAEIENNDEYSVLSEVTHDLNKIFSKLAKPLKDVVWQ